ncbi:ABC-2 type transport system ATP-binding protein [Bowdeniella nasicola]|uniref:ABC-2 type transport system ATP-binding protein n=1 Tax=Bowdeniella nasicola TaxID=208480 RepID=A0A1H4A9F3_9ACTO|nr:ATP-binding cassette domain-containing protein [Bowdeniella nasicola]SEA32104.1 ABC-2 type transport system ATP-binding protein [Bowdeniella nasicola]
MTDLVISGLKKKFGTLQALDDMSFTVHGGEIFGFVGSNGAGKSTTMRIALGVLSADEGEVTLGGKPLDLAARRRVGYMPEERGLYPKMKVGEQLIYLARLHGLSQEEAKDAMERWTDRLGIAARRDDDVQKLSLGNQQRVQLAAALVHDPEVLILDEPFSGLDPVAVNVMSSVLVERAKAGVPVVFSSHQLDLVERLCDRVGIVRNGQMIAEGTIDELRSTPRTLIDVTVADDSTGSWALPLKSHPSVEIEGQEGFTTRVSIPTGDASARSAVVDAAARTGNLTQFRDHHRSLAELFQNVVVTEDPAESDDAKEAAK